MLTNASFKDKKPNEENFMNLKNLAVIMFIALFSMPMAAKAAQPDRTPEQVAGAYFVVNGVITPELFRKVEVLVKKMEPEVEFEDGWFASCGGFSRRVSSWTGRKVLITWDGEIYLGLKKIGDWTNRN
jgi:hypothetical protein